MKRGSIAKLTNSSEETPIGELLSGDTIFSIPYFQRPYKWKSDRLNQLNQDILTILDESSDFHFLGAVIIHGRRSNPADPNTYDVIDGQQRITTLYLYICAIIKFLSDNDKIDDAVGLFLKYVVIGRPTKLMSNYRLHSCKDDREQLNYVIEDILRNKMFSEQVKNIGLKKLPSTGGSKGKIKNNYKAALRFIKSQYEQGGIEVVEAIYQIILQQISVVQIDVLDPTDGPKIFDSLNSRQEPMTIGDLVRNEIFSKVASENPERIEIIDQENWQPFYRKFKDAGESLFDKYFFPYGLIHDPNLKKSEVYGHLQLRWKEVGNPEVIIEQLSTFQNDFIDISEGTNLSNHSKKVHNQIVQLKKASIPSSTYPFLMILSKAIRDKEVSENVGIEILKLIESFLVRRALCGIEPTGLHAVFKRLWTDSKQKNAEGVKQAIKRHKTVTWPTNEDVKSSVESRALYGSGVTNYFLLEYDKSLGGDQPSDIPWVEHILPEKPERKWFEVFNRKEHEILKDTLPNLIPLSQKMNQQLSNKTYNKKNISYSEDSMFKSTRKVSKQYSEWTPEAIKKRGRDLSKWAIERWPE